MNKYEGEINGKSKEEKAEERDFQKLYGQVREIILNNKDYSWGASQDQVQKFSDSMDMPESEVILKILEQFCFQEGALPGQLEEIYINLFYSPEKFIDQLEKGKDFYEIINELQRATKAKGIILDSEAVGRQINWLKNSLDLPTTT